MKKYKTLFFCIMAVAMVAQSSAQVAQSSDPQNVDSPLQRHVVKGQRDMPVGYLLNSRFWAINTYAALQPLKLSGWEVDTVGGGRFSHQGLECGRNHKFFDWFRLEDTSTTAAVSLTHRIARQEKGEIVLEYRMRLDPLTQKGVAVMLMDGKREALRYEAPETDGEFGVKIIIRIDKKNADLFLNGQVVAKAHPLRNAIAGIDAIHITTGKEATGHVYLSPVEIHKGYIVNERFQTCAVGSLPCDWKATATNGNVSVKRIDSAPLPDVYSVKLDDTSSQESLVLQKSLERMEAVLVTTFSFLLPEKQNDICFALKNGKKTVWQFQTSQGNLCTQLPNGTLKPVVENYRGNLWYAVKVVSDTRRKTSDIFINGKVAAIQCPNIGSGKPADNFVVSTSRDGKGTLWLDDVQIHPYLDYPADYVPEPKKTPNDGILVGVQSCNLWREGMGYAGWEWITNDKSNKRIPLLGFYDEGNPEVTDWQIYWQAEHGIDFELHCWYRSDNATGYPVKRTPCDHEIMDGLFNARYRDNVKFMIMWEANLFGYTNQKDFRENLVPFWIEHLFKDPSYLKVDNKPVISVYVNTLRDFDNAKEELDYLRAECRKAGFDGAIVWHENNSSDPKQLSAIRDKGIDNVYAYTWYGDFAAGFEHQQACNRRQRDTVAQIEGLGMIPAVSNAFDNKAWQNRSGLDNVMTARQYRKMLEWLHDDFIKTMPKEEIGSKIVLLGNWNEFGEGHFLMPATLEGFGYIEAIRDVFTGKTGGAQTVPTESQQRRIDLLYPFDWK